MKPVSVGGCFGWLHTSDLVPRRDTAVLFCQGLLKDAMTAYVSARRLADLLADQGLPTLRFDYPGTGDSCDPDFSQHGGHWAAWQHSIDQAADWLRATTGARRIVLCGFRIGATLAALAAARRADVAGLLLIEPVLEGRSYVRQLGFEAQLLYGQPRAKDEDLQLHELRLPPATLAEIAAVDLRRLVLPAGKKVAVFARTGSKPLVDCVQGWQARGVDVSRPAWMGLDPMFADKLIDEAPLADFGTVLGWVQDTIPAQPVETPPRLPDTTVLHPPGVTETPLTFGPEGQLFGILSRPEGTTPESVVIIGNCGHDPHYGPGRQATTLARRLAASGVACLRIDFAGLGDSAPLPGKENVRAHVFSEDRTPELRAAVDTMEKMGFRRFGLQGTCSGAYHAFYAALADPRISTLMIVNIPLFTLPRLDLVGHLDQRWQPPLYYARKVFSPGSWGRLLRGERDLGLALRTQLFHAPLRVLGHLQGLGRRLGLMPRRSFAWTSMATLARRGVRTLFVFSAADADSEAFAKEFGRKGEGLAAFPGSEMKIVPGMDHGLMKAHERGIAEGLMTDFAR